MTAGRALAPVEQVTVADALSGQAPTRPEDRRLAPRRGRREPGPNEPEVLPRVARLPGKVRGFDASGAEEVFQPGEHQRDDGASSRAAILRALAGTSSAAARVVVLIVKSPFVVV